MINFISLALALAAGWILGGLGNWLADALPVWSPPPDTPAAPLASPRLEHWTALIRPARWSVRRRLPLLLAATMGVSGFAALRMPNPVALALAVLYSALLLTILVIDLEQRRVLNVMLGPAAVGVLLCSLLAPPPTFLMALAGGAVGFVVFLAIGIVGRGAMGGGDVKLMGLVGLMVGYPAIFAAMIYGVLLGGAAALFLLVTRRGTRKSTFAYAPYLAVGALIATFLILRGSAV